MHNKQHLHEQQEITPTTMSHVADITVATAVRSYKPLGLLSN